MVVGETGAGKTSLLSNLFHRKLDWPAGERTDGIKELTTSFTLQGKATEYDTVIAAQVGRVLSGGDTDITEEVTEKKLLELEREGFMTLIRNEKTLQRIEHMLKAATPDDVKEVVGEYKTELSRQTSPDIATKANRSSLTRARAPASHHHRTGRRGWDRRRLPARRPPRHLTPLDPLRRTGHGRAAARDRRGGGADRGV